MAFPQVIGLPSTSPPDRVGSITLLWPVPADLADLFERTAVSATTSARSAPSRCGRAAGWRRPSSCETRQLACLPASTGTVCAYFTDSSERPSLSQGARSAWRYSPATLERRSSAISWMHERRRSRRFGRDPAVRDVLAAIRCSRAMPPRRKAARLPRRPRSAATFDTRDMVPPPSLTQAPPPLQRPPARPIPTVSHPSPSTPTAPTCQTDPHRLSPKPLHPYSAHLPDRSPPSLTQAPRPLQPKSVGSAAKGRIQYASSCRGG